MSTKRKAGEWLFCWKKPGTTAKEYGLRIHDILPNGVYVVEVEPNVYELAENLDEYEHEPRCTGWDWVVPEPQLAEDPDELVILDPVKYADHVPRVGIDQFGSDEKGWKVQCAHHTVEPVGEYYDEHRLYHRCRRRDLPKVEQPKVEQCTPNSTDPACPDCGAVDCERAKSSSRECSSGFEPGQRKVCGRCGRMNCESQPQPQNSDDWSYHNQQKPQPRKTMLRLWIDSDCNVHAGLKGDGDLELFYDQETRQFYTEEQS